MIRGIGIDSVELSRIKADDAFARRILSDDELLLYEDIISLKLKVEFLGGRFACKEAFSKALGTGIGAIGFKDVSVLKGSLGEPIIDFPGYTVHVSITHTNITATAMIILEEKDEKTN